MVILNSKGLLKINMLLLLNKPISINKSLEIYHENIWQLFEKMSLVCFDGSAVLLVAFDVDVLEVVVETFFDGTLVVWDV